MAVLQEVQKAYADCSMPFEQGSRIRQLMFRASYPVSRDEAKQVFEEANVLGYNNFSPELLDKFPENCLITIAREYSVCIYVQGSNLPSAEEVLADEYDVDDDFTRYWWD